MMSGSSTESDAEFDARYFVASGHLDLCCRYVAYFDRADIDGWEIRKVSMVGGRSMGGKRSRSRRSS